MPVLDTSGVRFSVCLIKNNNVTQFAGASQGRNFIQFASLGCARLEPITVLHVIVFHTTVTCHHASLTHANLDQSPDINE